jgi:integrase
MAVSVCLCPGVKAPWRLCFLAIDITCLGLPQTLADTTTGYPTRIPQALDMPKLTTISVANAQPGQARREIHDSGCPCLYLVVQSSGHKSWALRYRLHGHSRKLTLGPVLVGDAEPTGDPTIDSPLSLAAARELAAKALRQIKGGSDPVAAKRSKLASQFAAEADTLQAIAAEYLRREGGKLRTVDQRSSDLDLLCTSGDGLGALPLEGIKRSQFVRVFDAIADKRGPVRADRVLNAGKRLLNWHAGRSDYVSVLTAVKRRLSMAERARERVLVDDELRAVWLAAETFPAPFGPFIRFVLLTATRRNEAGGLRRSELAAPDTWVLPRARWKVGAKAKADLVIPLSTAVQAIIAAQPSDNEFIFSSSGVRPLTNIANHKTKFDGACGVTGWTIHDLRRTARTLLSRVTSPDTAERCLGHALGGQRGTYDQHSYASEMWIAFEALAQRIELIVRPPPGATVTDLATERARKAQV